MKADAAKIGRALDKPGDGWRLALLYGPDEGGSRVLADRLATAMGSDAERVDLDGATLKEDPARLADEATAITMFGGPRWIRVTGGDECERAIEAFFEAPAGCPVVVIAGALKPASPLVKLALSNAGALAYASYKPEGGRADAIAMQLGRSMGVRLSNEAAHLIADATTGDSALMLRELEKLALYLDAAPDRPRPAERGDVEAIGAAIDVREPWTLVDAVFDGGTRALAGELTGDAATEMIPALRAIDRRALVVGRMLAARRGGTAPRMFNPREREAIDRQSRLWSPAAIATAHRRAMEAEAALKQPGAAGEVLAQHALIALARAAERRR